MKNRLIRFTTICGLVLVFAAGAVGEERERPSGKERGDVSDLREKFRNASPEERRRMMMEKRREREGQANSDRKGSPERNGPPDMEGRPSRGGDMQNRMLYSLISNPERAAKLGMSEEQAASIKQKLDENQANMQQLQEKMRATFRKQAELMSAETIDEGTLMSVVEEGGQLHTELAKARIRQLLIVKNALSPEQIKNLKNMHSDRRRRMMENLRGEGDQRRGGEGDVRRDRERNTEREQGRNRDRDRNQERDRRDRP